MSISILHAAPTIGAPFHHVFPQGQTSQVSGFSWQCSFIDKETQVHLTGGSLHSSSLSVSVTLFNVKASEFLISLH